MRAGTDIKYGVKIKISQVTGYSKVTTNNNFNVCNFLSDFYKGKR